MFYEQGKPIDPKFIEWLHSKITTLEKDCLRGVKSSSNKAIVEEITRLIDTVVKREEEANSKVIK